MQSLKCQCGQDVIPGQDECYACLGERPPKPWEFETTTDKLDYIKERPSNPDRVGSEEWKEEMRQLWPWSLHG